MALDITRNDRVSPMSDALRLLNGAPGVAGAFLLFFVLIWISSGTSHRDEPTAAPVPEAPVEPADDVPRIETYAEPSSLSDSHVAYPAPVGDSVSTETDSDVYLTPHLVDCAPAASAGSDSSDGYMSEWVRR